MQTILEFYLLGLLLKVVLCGNSQTILCVL